MTRDEIIAKMEEMCKQMDEMYAAVYAMPDAEKPKVDKPKVDDACGKCGECPVNDGKAENLADDKDPKYKFLTVMYNPKDIDDMNVIGLENVNDQDASFAMIAMCRAIGKLFEKDTGISWRKVADSVLQVLTDEMIGLIFERKFKR